MLLTFSARLCEFFGYLQLLTWQEIETLLFFLFLLFAFCFREQKSISCLGWFTLFPFIFEINKFSLLCLGNELIPQFLLSS